MTPTDVIEVDPPGAEPVTLALAKLHCKADIDVDDPLIEGMIVSARILCETMTSRAFISRRFRVVLPGFPRGCGEDGRIMLPRPPLASIESVEYIAPDGTTATLDGAAFLPSVGGVKRGFIEPAPGRHHPPTQARSDAVRIEFVAGYGPEPDDVPMPIRQAMLLLIGHWYLQREAATEADWKQLPFGVRSLLAPYRWGHYA